MEAAWAVVAAVSARAEKCVSPFSHYKPTADLTPFWIKGPLPLARDRSVPLDSRQTPPMYSPDALASTGIWPTSLSDKEKVR